MLEMIHVRVACSVPICENIEANLSMIGHMIELLSMAWKFKGRVLENPEDDDWKKPMTRRFVSIELGDPSQLIIGHEFFRKGDAHMIAELERVLSEPRRKRDVKKGNILVEVYRPASDGSLFPSAFKQEPGLETLFDFSKTDLKLLVCQLKHSPVGINNPRECSV